MRHGSVDIHEKLRLYTRADSQGRNTPAYEAADGVDWQRDVLKEIGRLSHRLGFIQSWLAAYRSARDEELLRARR